MTSVNSTCRACGTPLRDTFVDLGMSPLANYYVRPAERQKGDVFFPLHAYVCHACHLVQIGEFQSPEEIFADYMYFSSISRSWLRHAETYVDAVVRRFGLKRDSKVVEVASNDGYLLQYLLAHGVPVLGVEPAANVARIAIERGVPTEVAFFGATTAERLYAGGHAADLIVANNVVAHVPDVFDFVAGFRLLLKPEGVVTLEFPHLLRLIGETQFDTIYHEHFSYWSLRSLTSALERHALRVFDVEELSTHGGSLRVYACHHSAQHATSAEVSRVLVEEDRGGLADLSAISSFAARVVQVKCDTLEFLIAARREQKIVVGYGAAAKGNTFLNYCGIGPELLSVVADLSPHKQGKLLPGSRIPVVPPAELRARRPDYVLLLPWNLKGELEDQLSDIREWGGRFVTAIPRLSVF